MALSAADAETFERCIAVGGVAVFPADTVYGLACEPDTKEAVERLYMLKRRRPDKPAAVMFFALDLALAALPELGPRTGACAAGAAARPGDPAVGQPERATRWRARTIHTLGLRVPAWPPALAALAALVFGISASMCAVGGSMYAIRTNVVNPSDIQYFTLIGAIIFVVVMVLGGAATLWGPIVGSVVYIFLDKKTTEWGRRQRRDAVLFGWMTGSPAPFVLAVVLIVMMFVTPFGIVGLLRRFASRFVVIVPAPAGTSSKVSAAAAADPDLGAPIDPFDSNSFDSNTGGDQ